MEIIPLIVNGECKMATQEKICLIEKIEEILGDVSSRFLMERCGCIRLNACDVGLDIRAGTVYLDLQNEVEINGNLLTSSLNHHFCSPINILKSTIIFEVA